MKHDFRVLAQTSIYGDETHLSFLVNLSIRGGKDWVLPGLAGLVSKGPSTWTIPRTVRPAKGKICPSQHFN